MTATDWVASLSPWPEEFGLGRMRTLLANLGDPQLAYPSIHVVGTVGKGTAARTAEALLLSQGLSVGTTVSPHVSGWAERITVDGEEADFEEAIARVRAEAELQGATQFETITAAAFAEFAAREVDAAVVEAGLGGRLDATNVLESRVVLLTNVGLEHTDVLGATREEIAAEKLAVVKERTTVVLPDLEFAALAGPNVVLVGGARETAEAFLGRRIDGDVRVSLPGRLERRGDDVWDGAHTPEAAEWLLERLARRDYVLCVSILRDKNVDAILQRLRSAGTTLIATRSSNPRSLAAHELAECARRHFDRVESIDDPHAALDRAHDFGSPVLVTGSLYLLADLSRDPRNVV
jgi:dihydrofolate synthase / folylpolyglutamate synthase